MKKTCTADLYKVAGAGLGLRRVHLNSLEHSIPPIIQFMEIAPENWVGVGGKFAKQLSAIAEQVPLICHGLSLNLGGFRPLDIDYLRRLKAFLNLHKIKLYSEHLSYCGDDGLLYDLLPIPFTEEAVKHVVRRIKDIQDILEQRIAIENVSYYCAPGREMREIEFINAILEESDCGLLLDINNIYVNSINHDYDAHEFLRTIPSDRIEYAHIAGHFVESQKLRIDTHGADVIDDVWELLVEAYGLFGIFPTLLERDFNIPELSVLLLEVDKISHLQANQQHNFLNKLNSSSLHKQRSTWH